MPPKNDPPPGRRLVLVPVDELQDDPRNPKGHDHDALDTSIGTLGYIEPIVVDEAWPGCSLVSVRVWETPTSVAEVAG